MIAPSASAQTEISASPQEVYALVSDLPGLEKVAAEFQRGRWLGGVTEARVGARFRGTNKRAWRRWTTTVTVTDAEPGSRFAFEVTYYGLPISRWQYDFEPSGDGCLVREKHLGPHTRLVPADRTTRYRRSRPGGGQSAQHRAHAAPTQGRGRARGLTRRKPGERAR